MVDFGSMRFKSSPKPWLHGSVLLSDQRKLDVLLHHLACQFSPYIINVSDLVSPDDEDGLGPGGMPPGHFLVHFSNCLADAHCSELFVHVVGASAGVVAY